MFYKHFAGNEVREPLERPQRPRVENLLTAPKGRAGSLLDLGPPREPGAKSPVLIDQALAPSRSPG